MEPQLQGKAEKLLGPVRTRQTSSIQAFHIAPRAQICGSKNARLRIGHGIVDILEPADGAAAFELVRRNTPGVQGHDLSESHFHVNHP